MISRKKRLLLYLTNFRQIGSLFTKHEEMFHASNCNLVLLLTKFLSSVENTMCEMETLLLLKKYSIKSTL